LIDVEFAAQAWQMRQGLVETETSGVLKKMVKGEPEAARALQAGLAFWSLAEWWLRLDEGRGGSLLPKPGTDREWLAKRFGEADAATFLRKAAEISRETRKAYEAVLARLLQKS
jgi:glutamine synthetase adenylyltransferase